MRAGEKGAALVEWVISLPILMLLGLGCVQWALIWEAKTTLNYATLLAARAGAVSSLDIDKMNQALDKGLFVIDRSLPLRSLTSVRNYKIRILNPSKEAFIDFGEQATSEPSCPSGAVAASQCEIPNDRLERRALKIGQRSGVHIQDANLLKIEVTYGFELKVPFVGPLLGKLLKAGFPFGSTEYWLTIGHGQNYVDTYYAIPLSATATVRMQTPAHFNPQVLSREEVEKRAKGMIL